MNKFISGVLTGAALATGGLAVGLIWRQFAGSTGVVVADTQLPQPIPTSSPWPWSPFSYDRG